MNYPAAELRGIYLSFWLVQNLSVSKKDSRLPKAFGIAGMTNKKRTLTPMQSIEEFLD